MNDELQKTFSELIAKLREINEAHMRMADRIQVVTDLFLAADAEQLPAELKMQLAAIEDQWTPVANDIISSSARFASSVKGLSGALWSQTPKPKR